MTSGLDSLPVGPGTYCLLLRNPESRRLPIGRLGEQAVAPGWYLYVGSAFGPGGLRARLRHHLLATARPRWHIDYLRQHAVLREIWYSTANRRLEANWVRRLASLSAMQQPITGFGASDSRAVSHLFFSRSKPDYAALATGLLDSGTAAINRFVPMTARQGGLD